MWKNLKSLHHVSASEENCSCLFLQHEYDLVATDYEKAKSLFSTTQVNIFKRVLEEVEKQIAHFREDLKLQLLVLPSTLDQQKRLIKSVRSRGTEYHTPISVSLWGGGLAMP